MKRLISGLAAALLALSAGTALAQQQPDQNRTTPPSQSPGAGGVSKPGVAGKPGGKAGPTAHKRTGAASSDSSQQQAQRRQQDQSRVQGKPGAESGTQHRTPSSD